MMAFDAYQHITYRQICVMNETKQLTSVKNKFFERILNKANDVES